MIYFDFSKAGVSLERLEKCFETYCNVVLYLFIKDYASFYYDNFEECDAGVHYSIADKGLGISCYNEDELFESIRNVYEDYEHFRPGKDKINLFHKYIDNKSCERYFKEIIRSR